MLRLHAAGGGERAHVHPLHSALGEGVQPRVARWNIIVYEATGRSLSKAHCCTSPDAFEVARPEPTATYGSAAWTRKTRRWRASSCGVLSVGNSVSLPTPWMSFTFVKKRPSASFIGSV